MSIKEDREQFALGMAQLADLSKLCSEYVSSFTTPTPSNYEFGGAQIKIAQPKTSVFPTDAGSASFGTSEYDSNFVSATPMTEVKLTATKKKLGPKLDIGPYKEQKSTGWSSEYDAKYVPMAISLRQKKKKVAKSTPFSPAKAGHVGHEAAREAARRVHRRSFVNVLQEAEEKGKEMNEKHAEKHAAKAADPHPIAKIAAKAAAKKFSYEESSTAVPEKKSNRADGENVTEYDSKYKMPGYLRQLEKAAETAKLASMSLARKTGKCSEYVANFIDIDDGKIDSIEIAGIASGTNDGGASSAMDWEQEISAVNGTSSNTKNKGVANAWTSEYDGNFRDTFQSRKSGDEIIAGLPSGIDDGGASAAMEWEADEDLNEEDAAKPKLPVSETGWGESENHTEFKAYDISAMAKLSKLDSSSSTAAANAMDWTETTDKVAPPRLNGHIRKTDCPNTWKVMVLPKPQQMRSTNAVLALLLWRQRQVRPHLPRLKTKRSG